MSQITARRGLCLHPCEAGTCLQLPHFRAHPCPRKPRAILALPPQCGFPACSPELQHVPSPPHGAERDHVTHQNDKGRLTPQIHSWYQAQDWECLKALPFKALRKAGRGGPAGTPTSSWWVLVLRPTRRKHWVLLVKPRGLGWTHPVVSSPKVGTQHKTQSTHHPGASR